MPTRREIACPRCGSAQTELTSEFGPTACKALYRCTSCLEPYQPTAEELAFLRAFGSDEPESGFVHGVGCHLCAHTGFLERIGVYELLAVTDEVRELIVDRAPQDQMRKVAQHQGMHTLQEQAVRLVLDGTTTAAEVMRSIYVAGV